MKWRLKNYLDQHDLTPYSLVRATGISPTTIYGIAQGKHERVSLDVLQKVLWGLERLTGKVAAISDVLESEPLPDDMAATKVEGLGEVLQKVSDLDFDAHQGEITAEILARIDEIARRVNDTFNKKREKDS